MARTAAAAGRTIVDREVAGSAAADAVAVRVAMAAHVAIAVRVRLDRHGPSVLRQRAAMPRRSRKARPAAMRRNGGAGGVAAVDPAKPRRTPK